MSISVIIPSYKNPMYLDVCINSILKTQTYKNEIIIVLDGFVDISSHLIEKYKNVVTFIEFEENYGMANAINAGVNECNNENIFIINDDNVMCNKWDVNLLKNMTSDNLIITANQVEPIGPSIFNFAIQNLGTTHDAFDLNTFLTYEDSIKSDLITNDGNIFPFMMKKMYYMAVGGFDLTYNSTFIVDWDFFLKLELLHAKTIRVHDVNLYHFGSKATKNSTDTNTSRESFVCERNAVDIFFNKWGFLPALDKTNSHLPNVDVVKGINYKNIKENKII